MKKVPKMVGFVPCCVLTCIIRNISFLLFKSTHLGLIFKKGMHVEIFYVKVDQVTMYYIGLGNW